MASKTMNKRTVKRVKDPKGCAGCPECVQEPNGFGRPVTYRCRICPIKAGDGLCDKSPVKEKGSPPYQVFLKVPKEGKGIPEIVLMTEGMFKEKGEIHYPADHVLLDGVTVQDWNGWHVAQAIHDAVRDGEKYRKLSENLAHQDMAYSISSAWSYLNDICGKDTGISADSALALSAAAKKLLEHMAEKLEITLS